MRQGDEVSPRTSPLRPVSALVDAMGRQARTDEERLAEELGVIANLKPKINLPSFARRAGGS